MTCPFDPILVVDTREKRWEHIRAALEKQNVPFMVEKVPYGDYAMRGNPGKAVERKRSLEEISYNLFNRNDKHRFMREIRAATAKGIAITILIEHGKGVRTMQDVAAWQDQKTKVPGTALMARLDALRLAYGVHTVFCDPKDTAGTILRLLGGTTQ